MSKTSTSDYIALLSFLISFFGRKRKAAFLAVLTAALDAYDAVRATRAGIERAASAGAGLQLSPEEVAQLHASLLPLDRLATRIKNGDF